MSIVHLYGNAQTFGEKDGERYEDNRWVWKGFRYFCR